jgi:hypothetical protein
MKKLSADDVKYIILQYTAGTPVKKLADIYHLQQMTIYYHLKKAGKSNKKVTNQSYTYFLIQRVNVLEGKVANGLIEESKIPFVRSEINRLKNAISSDRSCMSSNAEIVSM